MTRLGVIVVHYRTPDDLRLALQSLRFQGQPLQVVVDASEEPQVRSWFHVAVEWLGDVRLVERPDNSGFGAACHAGWSALNEDVDPVCIASADVVFPGGALRKVITPWGADNTPEQQESIPHRAMDCQTYVCCGHVP